MPTQKGQWRRRRFPRTGLAAPEQTHTHTAAAGTKSDVIPERGAVRRLQDSDATQITNVVQV